MGPGRIYAFVSLALPALARMGRAFRALFLYQGASFCFLGEGTEAEEMPDLSPRADRGRFGLRPFRCTTLEHVW